MISSYLTDDEYRGRVPAVTAEARLAADFVRLSRKCADVISDRAAAEALRVAETGSRDWGRVGDNQRALALLVQIAVGLGITEGIDPRNVENAS